MSKTQHGNVASTPEAGEHSQAQWSKVYEAIAERWPQIDQGDLKQCDQSASAITDFVSQRVDAGRNEVEAAVAKFAPDDGGLLEPVTEKLRDLSDGVTQSIHSAIERAHYQIDEAPVKMSLGALATGFALGVLATAAYVRAHHQSSSWERMRDRFGRE